MSINNTTLNMNNTTDDILYQITSVQFSLLQSFMTHCWCTFHDNENSEFEFWAKALDDAKIPWAVQNTAAYLMDKRENGFYYFRNLLKSKGIAITKAEQ
jgi:hypothetical protein